MAFAHAAILHSPAMGTRRDVLKQIGLAVLAKGAAMGRAEAQQGGWQLAGSSAEAYEQYLVPAMMARWAELLVARAGVRGGQRVLDVGCGTGIVARTAAARTGGAGHVSGLDLNEEMLSVARRVAAGVRPAVEWKHGNAMSLPFADGAFDVVLSQQMLQFVPDAATALREMRRVTRAGGRVAVDVCRPIAFSPAYVPLAAALDRHLGPAAGAGMRSPFPEWSGDTVRELLQAAGLRDVQVTIDVGPLRYPSVAEFVRREAASSPLAAVVSGMPPAARDALLRDLAGALRDRSDDEGVVSPLEIYVATGRS
jgi:SAM-dependent methyltransferase